MLASVFFDELGLISFLLLPRFLCLRGVDKASPNGCFAMRGFLFVGAHLGLLSRISFCETFGLTVWRLYNVLLKVRRFGLRIS